MLLYVERVHLSYIIYILYTTKYITSIYIYNGYGTMWSEIYIYLYEYLDIDIRKCQVVTSRGKLFMEHTIQPP